ncbi:uncharacterized protein LOC62_04G005266 [Vanrija pseudolonga]|uniref:Uncharacterized protein n=1 Tax=Vanrija pseudolonga TaxID=143232 RepID=A0AAF0Y801_9TREE|nr:hypothetical protein LOC62_04G005266 [Vanrija pseudolonga]
MSISRTAYPGIIDRIVAASGVDALFALRAASREFRDRADASLLRHVEIAPAPEGALRLFSPDCARRALPLRPELVRVADLRQFTPWEKDAISRDAQGGLTALQALRRVGDAILSPDWLPSAGVWIDYINLHKYPRELCDASDYDLDEGGIWEENDDNAYVGDVEKYQERDGGHIKRLEMRDLPCSQRKYIAHIRLDDESTEPSNCPHFFARVRASPFDMVVVVHPPLVEDKRAMTFQTALDVARLGVLEGLQEWKGMTLTVVGLEGIGHDGASFIATRREQDTDWLMDKADSHTRFLSMAAWLDELGEQSEVDGAWVERRALAP